MDLVMFDTDILFSSYSMITSSQTAHLEVSVHSSFKVEQCCSCDGEDIGFEAWHGVKCDMVVHSLLQSETVIREQNRINANEQNLL